MFEPGYYQRREGGETAFTIEAPKIKFGAGAMAEVGRDAKALGMTRVALFTDPRVGALEPVAIARRSLEAEGLDVAVYDRCRVEPTDASFKDAIEFATEGKFDGFVSVGGGSVMDTAKAANLYATYPGDFLTYVNAPIGQGGQVPGPLKPHIACPTTFGTASECTGYAIFDFVEMNAKTGLLSPRMRPALGLLDPDNLKSLPTNVVAANGFDVFSHACESLTARPYTARPAPEDPSKRPLGQGANPYSDMACLEAIRLIGANLARAVAEPDDSAAREPLMFAGMLAGIGFGSAGCHLPHAMSYAVAGLIEDYRVEGWPQDHALVPHGISVIVNAPAVFRFTGPACPDRHLKAAEALGADMSGVAPNNAGDLLADRVVEMMRATGMPNGLSEIGYGEDDLDDLTDKANPQRRLIENGPIAPDRDQLKELFRSSMRYW